MGLLTTPTSVWAYGFLRALAFGAPLWLGAGRIGLGVIVVLTLYVALLARRRWAWIALVVLDTLSLLLLIASAASSEPGEVPLLVPILAALALGCLLLPGTRAHVRLLRATDPAAPPSRPPGTPG